SRVLLLLLVGAGAAEVIVAVWRRIEGKRAPLAPPVNVSYGFAAALLILIVSVLPAAAFFRVGHGLQIESFIKYGQLQVALDRIERARRGGERTATDIIQT